MGNCLKVRTNRLNETILQLSDDIKTISIQIEQVIPPVLNEVHEAPSMTETVNEPPSLNGTLDSMKEPPPVPLNQHLIVKQEESDDFIVVEPT